jgi:hypothetical protein
MPSSGTKTPATKVDGSENLVPSAMEALIPRYPLPMAKSASISRSRAGFTPSSTNSQPGSAVGESEKSFVLAWQLDIAIDLICETGVTAHAFRSIGILIPIKIA